MGTVTSDPPETGTREGRTLSSGTDSDARSNGTPGVSRDDLFDVLSNHRRRYALHSLKQGAGTLSIGNLAEEIAAWENDVSIPELTAADRKRVYTSLQQFHLPKMHTAGIIEFDGPRGMVTLTEAAGDIDVYLDVVAEDDIPWSRYYLGLSAMSLAVVTGVWLVPFTLLPALAWAALVAAIFLLSALVHTYYNRRMRLGAAGAPPGLSER
jgi:hypothetical protein